MLWVSHLASPPSMFHPRQSARLLLSPLLAERHEPAHPEVRQRERNLHGLQQKRHFFTLWFRQDSQRIYFTLMTNQEFCVERILNIMLIVQRCQSLSVLLLRAKEKTISALPWLTLLNVSGAASLHIFRAERNDFSTSALFMSWVYLAILLAATHKRNIVWATSSTAAIKLNLKINKTICMILFRCIFLQYDNNQFLRYYETSHVYVMVGFLHLGFPG